MRYLAVTQEHITDMHSISNNFRVPFLIAVVFAFQVVWPGIASLKAGGINKAKINKAPAKAFLEILQNNFEAIVTIECFKIIVMKDEIYRGFSFRKKKRDCPAII